MFETSGIFNRLLLRTIRKVVQLQTLWVWKNRAIYVQCRRRNQDFRQIRSKLTTIYYGFMKIPLEIIIEEIIRNDFTLSDQNCVIP